jgi:hypothetical protein
MSKMVWIILLQMLWGALNAQYKEYPKLQKLFDAGKYEKCIKKAESYSKKESKEPLPYLYAMKSWLAIADNDDENRSAINKAIAAARKGMRKDKEDKLYERFYEDYDLLHKKAFEKADGLVKNGKCSQAIRIYGNINELFGDRLSNYKKSLCMLLDENTANDGFILLRNTIIGVYKDYKTAQPITTVPEGFARLSNEYLLRAYFYNAEDVLRKGVEVFPADTAIRNEMVSQSTTIFKTSIQSDLRKDLYKLRNHLLWVDSCYAMYPPVQTMLKETNYKIINQYIKYEYTSPDSVLGFIKQCSQYDTAIYSTNAINLHLISLYNNHEVRRIDGALDNLTKVLINLNLPYADNAHKAPAQYVFDYLLQLDNYGVAAYFIKQAKTLYPKDKAMLNQMQVSLENKLVELLTAAPKEPASLDLADKFTAIAPANKKLSEIEKGIYYDILKTYKETSTYSAFYTIVNRGLSRFVADPTMMKMKKEMAIKDFNENCLKNRIEDFKEMKVIFHVATCTPGKVDTAANIKFTNMLNYLRRQAGVYDSCFLDAELNEMAQQAALMMKARNDLSHSPDEKWKCYSLKGKKGAGSSNLSLGYSGTDALLGQVEDDGDNNSSVGHRRWVLNPYNKVFGHGSTDNTMALYVFGKYFNNPAKDKLPQWNKETFVSWPPKDFAPIALVPQRWSFSLEDADYGKAKITVTLKGKKVNISTEDAQQGYGLNTLVWKMNDKITPGDVYTITITNVGVIGKTTTQNYTYTIEVLDLDF